MTRNASHMNIREKWLKATDGAGNGETLTYINSEGKSVGIIYYNPVASRTGVLLKAGEENGQVLKIVNTASGAFSITFAAVGTSNIIGGTSVVIAQNQSMNFVWSVTLAGWIPVGAALNSAVGTSQIAAASVTGAKLSTGVGYFTVAKTTNGATPVNVIAATVPFAATITGIYGISNDTTAGTITIADTAGTVGTFAKGATSGALVGVVSLANTAVASGDTLTIVSSSAGNATVFITFTVA